MEPLAYIGASICALSMTVAAWGVAKLWMTIITTVGRNPQVKKDVDIYGWAGFAAIAAIALFGLVIALIMLTGGEYFLGAGGTNMGRRSFSPLFRRMRTATYR